MKRSLTTILAILYMASAMGATVHLHYCMGEFVNATLVQHDEHQCDKCGMVKSSSKQNGCCKDEHKTIKTTDHQQAKPFAVPILIPVTAGPVIIQHFHLPAHDNSDAATGNTRQVHAPPGLWRTCPIYLQVRNIRV